MLTMTDRAKLVMVLERILEQHEAETRRYSEVFVRLAERKFALALAENGEIAIDGTATPPRRERILWLDAARWYSSFQRERRIDRTRATLALRTAINVLK
jgi:hypothetical protein